MEERKRERKMRDRKKKKEILYGGFQIKTSKLIQIIYTMNKIKWIII